MKTHSIVMGLVVGIVLAVVLAQFIDIVVAFVVGAIGCASLVMAGRGDEVSIRSNDHSSARPRSTISVAGEGHRSREGTA